MYVYILKYLTHLTFINFNQHNLSASIAYSYVHRYIVILNSNILGCRRARCRGAAVRSPGHLLPVVAR